MATEESRLFQALETGLAWVEMVGFRLFQDKLETDLEAEIGAETEIDLAWAETEELRPFQDR